MSTTIESRRGRAVRFLLAASFVLAVWFSLVAVGTVVAEPTRVVVLAPGPDALRVLVHSDARLVSGGPGFMIAEGQNPGFVRALYAGGAWLVLPASTGGCRAAKVS